MQQRILLLDDEAPLLAALRRALRSGLGPQVQIESTVEPEEALGLLRQMSFDVVVSDFRMPLMSGAEFLGMVRSVQPGAVRMILSASSDFSDIMHVVNEVEIFRYLAKPWNDAELVSQMRQALAVSDERRSERDLADVGRAQFGLPGATQMEAREPGVPEPGIDPERLGPSGELLLPEPDTGAKDR